MRIEDRIGAVIACCALGAGLAAAPAQARIICHGDFQVVAGNEISTPYCRDKHLAQVARRSGFRVTDRELMYNPNVKRAVCRFLSHNIEVQQACEEVQGRSGRRY